MHGGYSRCIWVFVMAADLCLHQASAEKRTMPMFGMDEEGEEVESEGDMPATQRPRSAAQALINGFLGQVLHFPLLHVVDKACHIRN